jgi:hypothetical protein
MAPDVLAALLDYLADHELLTRAGRGYVLAPAGEALLEYEEGTLDQVRAYQPVLQALEHLLARLKMYGGAVARRADIATAATVARYEREVYPAVREQLAAAGVAQVLDLCGGSGDLLCYLAQQRRELIGVGISSEVPLARQANALIDKQKLDKRLIAIPADPVDVCTNTGPTFERIGVSRPLWEKFDGLLAIGFLGGSGGPERPGPAELLRALAENFPYARLVVGEPCVGAELEQNYDAPEQRLLARLSHAEPRSAEAWMSMLTAAGYAVQQTQTLATDGLTLFVCAAPRRRPGRSAARASRKPAQRAG